VNDLVGVSHAIFGVVHGVVVAICTVKAIIGAEERSVQLTVLIVLNDPLVAQVLFQGENLILRRT